MLNAYVHKLKQQRIAASQRASSARNLAVKLRIGVSTVSALSVSASSSAASAPAPRRIGLQSAPGAGWPPPIVGDCYDALTDCRGDSLTGTSRYACIADRY